MRGATLATSLAAFSSVAAGVAVDRTKRNDADTCVRSFPSFFSFLFTLLLDLERL